MDYIIDAMPFLFAIIVTLVYRLIGKPSKQNNNEEKETLSRTLEIIDDRLELHEDLVNIYKELQAIHELLRGKTDDS